ncbi:MAG: aminotransferase class V-fold PLP-dependent enzyme, partial [Gemmatimonadetes bacterium]|nr:aminotransferase class V-fold PLP-dependent enzyme [Gemmatimonadota bacterium]
QYPSKVYAWKELAARSSGRLHTVPRGTDGTWTERVLEAIDGDTAVVAVPNCHWTDGSLLDLPAVGARVRAVGAALVVDASQSLGAYPLDVEEVQPDFLVSVGYKWLLGPYGLAYLYAAPRWRESGRPIEYSWLAREGADDFSRLVEYTETYRGGARRFDAGGFPQFVLIPMAIAAVGQVLDWGVEAIAGAISPLTAAVEAGVREAGAEVLPASSRCGHMAGIRLRSGVPESLGEQLAAAGIYVSVRGQTIRVSPHVYNSEEDVERLLSVLRASLL